MINQTTTPTCTLNGVDYMTDEKGHLIPVDSIKPIDKLRDETVINIANKALTLNSIMKTEKEALFSLIYDFLELSASEYKTQYGGKKGNVSLPSFDGAFKVQIAMQDNIVFDERLQIAKNLIHECIGEWSEGSDTKIMTLVNDAFQVDKEGKVSTYRVLGLRRHDFDDPKWLEAMQAIADATQITSTKEYIRIYKRDENGKYDQIPLDFSKV
ncbi:DUF3164 family protein [Psychrobacter aquaticus]|uniref:Sulfate transporter n=1 Tax=Psychrobacter aquaticus CMS 56 TaxID=1354303 RepID=U4T7S0_9GAMM|nr:DUF3164 family protein [Psychrobacter aquaticus]ERL56171.1 hypothetical protein M917_0849 [Psychrobacter aquaticus CMS 56]